MIPATRSRGILQEIAGTWKQYSDRKLSGFFPVDSCQFPVHSGRNRSEIIGKIRKFSGRNTASTKSPDLPGTGSFRTGLFDLGTVVVNDHPKIENISNSSQKQIGIQHILNSFYSVVREG
jgi:hypothetical protein